MTPAQYLLSMGLKTFQQPDPWRFRFENETHMVTIGRDRITVYTYKPDPEFDDFPGEWRQKFHLYHVEPMTIDQFISLMDMTGVVPYKTMLAKMADESGMTDKRALYHIREAVKRTA